MTTCTCKNPPGGSTDCPDDHAALCEVINGICRGVCVPVPSSVLRSEPTQLHAWLLTQLLRREVGANEVRANPELRAVIRSREYHVPGTGAIVRFALPKQSFRPPREEKDDEGGGAAGGMTANG